MSDTVYTISGPPAATASASPTLADAITAAQTNAAAAAGSAATALEAAASATESALTASDAAATLTLAESTIAGDLAQATADVASINNQIRQMTALATQLTGDLGAGQSAAATASAASITATNAAATASSAANTAADHASDAADSAIAAAASASTFDASLYLAKASNLSDVADPTAVLGHLGGAPLVSPAFTDVPTAPTATVGTNTAQLATTAFVLSEISAISSGVLSFNTRSGAVAPASGDYAVADVTGAAPLDSPAFTGTPTLTVGADTYDLATTNTVSTSIAAATIDGGTF